MKAIFGSALGEGHGALRGSEGLPVSCECLAEPGDEVGAPVAQGERQGLVM
jgi:hypothetical protein